MDVVLLAGCLLLICFSFVLLFGAPYLPTKKKQIETSLALMSLKKGGVFIELGCGDGRVLRAAAKQGIRGVGYELNPILYAIAKISLFKYRHIATVKLKNFWTSSWPQADAIFVFLLDKYMWKLDKKMNKYSDEQKKQITLVSFAFKIPGKKIAMSKNGLFVYHYK